MLSYLSDVVPTWRLFVTFKIKFIRIVAEVARDVMVLLFGSDDAHWADLERHQVDDLVQE